MIVINTIYTIGYTAFPINEFLDVIKHYGIHCVIDVRSSPFSNYYSDYNKDELENTLKQHKIHPFILVILLILINLLNHHNF